MRALAWYSVFISMLLSACAGKTASPEAPAASAAGGGAPAWKDAATFDAACQAGLEQAKAIRAAIKAGGERTEAGTLEPYNRMLLAIDGTMNWASLMASVHPDKAVRDAGEKCEREVQKLVSEISRDRGIYEAVKTADVSGADPQTKRFVERLLRDFRRAGVDKDDATRAELEKLHAQMVEIGQTFSRNIREDVRKIEVDPADLKGLPADFIAADSHKPNEHGKVVLTTDYPDYFPVQQYAQKEEVRKQLEIAFLDRGHPANDEPLEKLLELRRRYAEILGYPSWAAYNAEDKMVKTAPAIESFIQQIAGIARPRMEKDLAVLLEWKRKESPKAATIDLWDRFYWVEKVRSAQYGFDSQAVRPYFEFGAVTRGLMELYGELFGVRFVRDESAPVWHESVMAYDLFSGEEKIGRFYLDMHPREGKYKHAAEFPLHTGLAGGQIPQASLVCNFADPSKTQGPALMEHSQVVTYFHEFGHLVHHLLARGSRWVSLSGITVEWDFVEAPSQLLEEWAWDPAVLARFARHVETGQPIPAELVKKMRASSEFGKGVHVMRQVFLTALSYHYHAVDPAKLDLLSGLKDIHTKYMPYPYAEGTHMYASFGHLEGYSSMYYTYQWSLVLAKDIFTRFEKAGLLDAQTARDYREKILMPGGSADAADLVKSFLGREHSADAYKAWLEQD